MTVPIRKLVGTAILAAMMTTGGRAQAPVPDGPRYLIAYLEVMPTAANEGAALARKMRDAMRRETGNLRSEALQRIGRPHQLVILSAWKDPAALDAHAKAGPTAPLDDKLKRIENAPADARVTFPWSVGPLPASPGADPGPVVPPVRVLPPPRGAT